MKTKDKETDNPYNLDYNKESLHFKTLFNAAAKKEIWDRITARQDAAKERQEQYKKYLKNY